MRDTNNLFEAFSRLSLEMQEALPLEQGLASILENAHQIVGVDRFNILIADLAEGVLRSIASWGNLEEPLEGIWVPIDARGGGLAKAYRDRVEILFNGQGPVPEELRLAPPSSHIKAFRSRHFAILPLICRETVIGVLGADNKFSRRPINTDTLTLLRIFAAHAAIAIHNARLFQETQARAEKLRALSALSRTIIATLDLQQVFEVIIRASADLLEAPVASLWTLEGDRLTLQRSRGLPSGRQAHHRFRLGEGIVGWIAQHQESVVLPEFAADPRVKDRDWAVAEGLHAFAGFPLSVGHRCVGVLTVLRRSPRPFAAEEVQLLAAFANQAAVAVDNARLYAQLRSHSVSLEEIVRERTDELRRRNLELEEADRHKSAFLATMSHELRTPLNSIIGFSELLRDKVFGDLNTKQERYIDNVIQSGRHLLNLINDILDMVKIESGRMELHLEEVSTTQTLNAVIAPMQPEATKKGVTLEFSEEADLPPLVGDPMRLRQILTHLLGNAVKFTPPGGNVTVTARVVCPTSEAQSQGERPGPESGGSPTSDVGPRTLDCGEFMEISVSDTGIGIREEDLERIFLPFIQGDASLARKYEGTGLGLALTQRMVTIHGGRIWAESEGEGKGSRFIIRFPTKGGRR